MPFYVRDNTGGWRVASQSGGVRPKVHNGTAWQDVATAWVHDGTGWRLVYQYDNTGPTVSSLSVTKLSAGSSIRVNHGPITDTESGISSVTLERYYQKAGSSAQATETVATITNFTSTYTDIAVANDRRMSPTDNLAWQVFFRIRATDVAGNVTLTPWTTGAYTKPLGTFVVSPTSVNTYSLSKSKWIGGSPYVISGWYDTTFGYQNGYFFYGATLGNRSLGYDPDSASIYLKRYQSYGYSGNNYIAPHPHATQPTVPTPDTGNIVTGPNLTGSGVAATYPFSSTWLGLIGDGTMLGVATRGGQAGEAQSSIYYRVLDSITATNNGDITLVFN